VCLEEWDICMYLYITYLRKLQRVVVAGVAGKYTRRPHSPILTRYSLHTHTHALQHTATHYNTLQYTATHCNTLQYTATQCNTLQHTATHCNTLQHTATHCTTHLLQSSFYTYKHRSHAPIHTVSLISFIT